jgi:hypothetical protein
MNIRRDRLSRRRARSQLLEEWLRSTDMRVRQLAPLFVRPCPSAIRPSSVRPPISLEDRGFFDARGSGRIATSARLASGA